jgi:hypothetical protein
MRLPRPSPPQERQVDTQKPALCGDLRSAIISDRLWQRVAFYLYSETEFLKIVAFKGGDKKIFKYGCGSYWKPKVSPICLFIPLFSWQCPFKMCLPMALESRLIHLHLQSGAVSDSMDHTSLDSKLHRLLTKPRQQETKYRCWWFTSINVTPNPI